MAENEEEFEGVDREEEDEGEGEEEEEELELEEEEEEEEEGETPEEGEAGGKIRVAPEFCAYHDEEKYTVEIELPGVNKEDIVLEGTDSSLCVFGDRGDLEYSACYFLAHEIAPEKADARYENGILTVDVPLKAPLRSVKIEVK